MTRWNQVRGIFGQIAHFLCMVQVKSLVLLTTLQRQL